MSSHSGTEKAIASDQSCTERAIASTQSCTERTIASTQSCTERTIASDQSCTEKVIGVVAMGDTTPPVITGFDALEPIGRQGGRFSWDTNELAKCQINYGTQSTVESDWTAGTIHGHFVSVNRNYVLGGLSEGTWYWCRAYGSDQSGNIGSSEMFKFLTATATAIGSTPIEV